MYKDECHRKRILYKFNTKTLRLKYKKFELFLNLRAVKDINFIRFNLKKIALAKELFVKELEFGSEVFIPSEMS